MADFITIAAPKHMKLFTFVVIVDWHGGRRTQGRPTAFVGRLGNTSVSPQEKWEEVVWTTTAKPRPQ